MAFRVWFGTRKRKPKTRSANFFFFFFQRWHTRRALGGVVAGPAPCGDSVVYKRGTGPKEGDILLLFVLL